ncbi:MAG: hypothetical protein M2R45_01478 [Verrucomicrobia subdivision 3 bacterium]|nr:hypothetical protein [Limisphaerales bacterium]MCS1413392.1 hypothetical protein [Limisphaerales bacterium]
MFLVLHMWGRRKMLDIIKRMPGCRVNDVAKYFEMSRIEVMKHLGMLEAAAC